MSELKKNILIIGSGGREHALAWKLSQSSQCGQLYTAPGNAGTAKLGKNLDINENDFETLKNTVLDLGINLVVVGPEAPLVKGIVDFFKNDESLRDISIIGPSAQAAQLEGSKDFAKAFMTRHNIPTASYKTFYSGQLSESVQFIKALQPPYVLKADGLAAGKGVIITGSLDEAETELNLMLNENKFGDAGKKVVIEEFLDGIELSVFVITDGINYLILPEAKDYKRIGEQDTGPNTGGMGAISPVPFADAAFMNKVEETIIKPTINGLMAEKIPYKGFIFFGLIKVKNEPFVIEYNARLGDPETEVVLPRIKDDLLEIMLAVEPGKLDQFSIHSDSRSASCVMMVAPGYPGSYPKGMIIHNLDLVTDVIPFHAGTKMNKPGGEVITNGGRILGITAMAGDLQSALEKSYKACSVIQYDGKYYRTDLGKDVLK